MGLVHSRTGSGLLLAEEGADAASISRALRQYDPELLLQPDTSEEYRCTIWKVYRYQGDQPPAFVLAFCNEKGEPYPLSSRLLDMVRAQDKNTRHATASEDALNELARQRRDRDRAALADDLIDDMQSVSGRGHAGLLPRSQSLRRARDKRRARGEKC